MPTTLTLKNIPDEVYNRLRRAAETNRRSLNSEAIVRLEATLVPGINTDEIGAIVDFAKGEMPTVRAVHFQPVSYFGRNPGVPGDGERITLPEVMEALVEHAGGFEMRREGAGIFVRSKPAGR